MAKGIRLDIGLNDFGLRRALTRATKAGEDLAPGLQESGQLILGSTQGRFESGVGPDGIAWPPSNRIRREALPNPSKRARKNRMGPIQPTGKTLVNKGNLRDSLRSAVEGNAVEVGVDARGRSARYAATHQFGATIFPKKGQYLVFAGGDGGLVFAAKVTIPARPFLGIDAGDVVDLERLWLDYVRRPFDGH